MGFGPATSLTDLLPTTTYRNVATDDEFTLTEAYVIGEVIDAVPGRYFYSQDDDESLPESTEVKSDDRRAAWATIHVTVRPTYWSSPANPDMPTEVTFGLAVSANSLGKFASELKGFGTIAAPLHRSAVFSYDDEVFSVYLDGAFLATVGERGRLEFPFWSADEEGPVDLSGFTTESVISAGRQPRIVDLVG